MKSFRPKGDDGSGGGRDRERDFHGEKRSNETHGSTTDPDARLHRKGRESKLFAKTGKRRKTRIDGRTTRHPGYQVSRRIGKRIEEVFGWVKVQGGRDKTKFRGRVDGSFTLAPAAHNLVRLPKLLAGAPP